MFKVQLFETSPGMNRLNLVQDRIAEMPNRADAITFIETYISTYAESDFDARTDRWWCRDRGDNAVKILVITGADHANTVHAHSDRSVKKGSEFTNLEQTSTETMLGFADSI